MNDTALSCHPISAGSHIRRFSVTFGLLAGDCLSLRFRIDADTCDLLLPESTPTPERRDGLWQHTCMEAFIRMPGSGAYHEFNFSPSGDWAVYRFDSYRAGMTVVALDKPPRIATRTTDHELEMDVAVPLPQGIAAPRSKLHCELHLALTAVVETRSGGTSYWAVEHAPAKPDFHYPEGFVLRLEPCSRAV